PGFIQDAGLFALNCGKTLETQIAKPFSHRHAAVSDYFKRRGLPTVPSTATMYLMVDIRATGLSGEEFAHRLLDAEGIAVMPGESFGRAAAGHLRVALTVEEQTLMAAVEKLADLADKLVAEAA
ncbi:MAG: aminotransferase class I/II-fold pyridoxal phosphate-dependent enzyme, partial [Boseongicola sp.]